MVKFVNVSPSRVRMTGEAGEEIKAEINVVPEEKYPFKILEAKSSNEKNIRVEMEEKKNEKGVEYLLTVFNVQDKQARYFEKIILKTDSKLRPELKINVYGNITDKKPGTKSDNKIDKKEQDGKDHSKDDKKDDKKS